MSRMIELLEDVYARIKEAATSSGHSVAEVIASRFPEPAANPCTPESADGSTRVPGNGTAQPPRTLADEFAGRVGLISSGKRNLARRAGELFADGMLEKKREGHL